MQWPRMTTRRLMIGVALVAVVLPAFRVDLRLGFGLCIILACIVILAIVKTAEEAATNVATARVPVDLCFLKSLAKATALIVGSDLTFVVVYVLHDPSNSPAVLVIAVGALVAVVVASRLKRVFWPHERDGRSNDLETLVTRLRRMTIRRKMAVAAVFALAFGTRPLISELRTYCDSRANPHELVAVFSRNERLLFEARAATCWRWAADGVPWDCSGEEAETLRLCPDQCEPSRTGSWDEQANGWVRASVRALMAEDRHSRIADAHMLWGAIVNIHDVFGSPRREQGLRVTPFSTLVLWFGLWLCFRRSAEAQDRSRDCA